MEYDLVVRNGLVVDGTGAPAAPGDIAVVGERIVAVGKVDGGGRSEIDATGLVVAPGFVDAHTHMDAQVFWDELGSSACWHGVTTVVMGNCGYTFAPMHPEHRKLVSCNIERAEDIPAESMESGMPWNWTSFRSYLDVLDNLPKGINYAQVVGHSALRIWAMGNDAFERAATPDEVKVMALELTDALRAGAAGLSTSRVRGHMTSDDRPVASRQADWDEVVALVSVLSQEKLGTFGAGNGGEADLTYTDWLRRLQSLALSSGVPVVGSAPFMETVEICEETASKGGQMWGMTHSRQIGTMSSFLSRLCFDTIPDSEWQRVRRLPLPEQRKLLEDPDVRARLVYEAHHGEYRPVAAADPYAPDYDHMSVYYSAYLPNPTVAEEARRRGVDPVEAIIDIALENDFDIFFCQWFPPFAPPDDTRLRMMRSPNTAMTFSDAGAHALQVCDYSIQTHLLAYWVRERQLLGLEEAIHMITDKPARIWNLHDRGRLAPGYAADITVFDPDKVQPLMPRLADDLPGGARRLCQGAAGYVATIVNGQVFTRDGEATAARAGRLLRSGRDRTPSV